MRLLVVLSLLVSFSVSASPECKVADYTIDALRVTLKSDVKEAVAYDIMTQTLSEDPCLQYLFELYLYELKEGSRLLALYIYNDYYNGFTIEELLGEFLADL